MISVGIVKCELSFLFCKDYGRVINYSIELMPCGINKCALKVLVKIKILNLFEITCGIWLIGEIHEEFHPKLRNEGLSLFNLLLPTFFPSPHERPLRNAEILMFN